MRILIIEDDPNKSKQLREHIMTTIGDSAVEERRSYQSGLKSAASGIYDVVILDMSLPTYDISPRERGGRTRPFAGREILSELARRDVHCHVIIVTQFESFGEGSERMTLRQLNDQLRNEFQDRYIQTVYYQAAESGWRMELTSAFSSIKAMETQK